MHYLQPKEEGMKLDLSNIECLLKKYLAIVIYFVLGFWLTLAFTATLYLYKKQLRQPSIYSNTVPIGDDSAHLEIATIKDGKIYGNIKVRVKTEKAKKLIDQGGEMYVRYFTVNGNPQYGEWVELKSIENKYNNYILTTDKEIMLYSLIYASRYFPFDKYYITFNPSLIIVSKTGDVTYEEPISHREVQLINLPYQFTSDKKITDAEIEKLLNISDKGGVSIVLKRPLWFLWLFGGILGFLLIPVMILIHADTKTISFDIIALVVSFMSVRSFFVGETKIIYPIDAYFCFLVFFSGLVVIYKLCRKEFQQNL